MEIGKGKGKKSLFVRTWERCRSIHASRNKSPGLPSNQLPKSKSWHGTPNARDEDKRSKRRQVAPEGCFSVYVGPQKQRFVIKTKYANHPLFKMLLEEAEMEYGYNSEGPLALPCSVDFFYKVLSEMDGDEIRQGCSFAKGHSSYRLLSPCRTVAMNWFWVCVLSLLCACVFEMVIWDHYLLLLMYRNRVLQRHVIRPIYVQTAPMRPFFNMKALTVKLIYYDIILILWILASSMHWDLISD